MTHFDRLIQKKRISLLLLEANMKKTKICGVVLPDDVAHEARVVAAKEGKSRSKLMRDLLIEYLDEYNKPKTLQEYINNHSPKQ